MTCIYIYIKLVINVIYKAMFGIEFCAIIENVNMGDEIRVSSESRKEIRYDEE